jgi:hypothetical protein
MTYPAEKRPSVEQIQAQLAKILASRHFRQARSLEKFLNFVTARTLAGELDHLKELTIGIEVFQRAVDFDPRIDNVVRVQAANLRKKLTEYYQEEGAQDEVLIDLPKGHYLPTFSLRERAVSIEPATPLNSRAWLKVAGLIALGLVLGAGVVLGYTRWPAPPPTPSPGAAPPDPVFLPIWEKFSSSETENLLAYGTPQFFAGAGLYCRDVLLNSPQDLRSDSGSRMRKIQESMRISLNPTEIYTGVGEAHGIGTLSRFFARNNLRLNISRSRIVGWQNLRNTNLIFLSSVRFHTLLDELGYPTDFAVRRDDTSARIINLKPATGELPSYGPNGDYAIITLWPGKSESLRILQLSGVTTWATLAAAEYVTDPESMRILKGQLDECRKRKGLSQHSPYFQILIKTEVKDNFPISINYVTHHDLDISIGGNSP